MHMAVGVGLADRPPALIIFAIAEPAAANGAGGTSKQNLSEPTALPHVEATPQVASGAALGLVRCGGDMTPQPIPLS